MNLGLILTSGKVFERKPQLGRNKRNEFSLFQAKKLRGKKTKYMIYCLFACSNVCWFDCFFVSHCVVVFGMSLNSFPSGVLICKHHSKMCTQEYLYWHRFCIASSCAFSDCSVKDKKLRPQKYILGSAQVKTTTTATKPKTNNHK